MKDAILDFAKQFRFQPEVINAEKLGKKSSFILTGMGGSHLAADLVLKIDPTFDLVVHRDYGLPVVDEQKYSESLFIASSYSGNTEEVVFAYEEAKARGMDMAVIAVGGKLIEMAQEDGVPYVQIPNTGIQPRSALAFSFIGLLKLLGRDDLLQEIQALADRIDPASLESTGKELADWLKDRVPVVYCSRANETIAWNWKIKFNETGKIPAFYNVFPELNHNEMTGFDVTDDSKHLSDRFAFVMLKDSNDHPKVQKRMDVVEKLYRDRGFDVRMMDLQGQSDLEKVFTSLLIADWTAVHIAQLYGLESEQVPMVEEFKKMIA